MKIDKKIDKYETLYQKLGMKLPFFQLPARKGVYEKYLGELKKGFNRSVRLIHAIAIPTRKKLFGRVELLYNICKRNGKPFKIKIPYYIPKQFKVLAKKRSNRGKCQVEFTYGYLEAGNERIHAIAFQNPKQKFDLSIAREVVIGRIRRYLEKGLLISVGFGSIVYSKKVEGLNFDEMKERCVDKYIIVEKIGKVKLPCGREVLDGRFCFIECEENNAEHSCKHLKGKDYVQ